MHSELLCTHLDFSVQRRRFPLSQLSQLYADPKPVASGFPSLCALQPDHPTYTSHR